MTIEYHYYQVLKQELDGIEREVSKRWYYTTINDLSAIKALTKLQPILILDFFCLHLKRQ
jgi:hypothetical protein